MVPYSKIEDAVRILAEVAHPEKIVLFGSYARGEPSQDSDVDLLIIVREPVNKAQEMVRLGLATPADPGRACSCAPRRTWCASGHGPVRCSTVPCGKERSCMTSRIDLARHFLAWQSVISGRSKSSSMIRMWTRRRLVSSRSKLWKSASKLCSRAMNRSFRSYRARRWPRRELRNGCVWGGTACRRPSCAGAIAVASRTSSGCTGPLRTDDSSSTIRTPRPLGSSLVAKARRPTSQIPRSGQL